jgi:hypothetical protein
LLGRRCGQCCNHEKIEKQMLHNPAQFLISTTAK